MASVNLVCLSGVKAIMERGSDSTTFTKCAGAAAMAVTQSDSSILPGAAVFPGGQLTQTSGDRAALAAEKEPAGQLTQVVSEEAPHEPENVPAAHLVHSVAPSPDEYLPATQSPHVSDEVAARVDEDLPAMHERQPASSLAVVVAYLIMESSF